MCGLQMVDSNRGSLPNGKGLLSDSGPFLDPSEQMIQIESPASPDPVSEVSWLPPLYIPEIPLSCDEVEEEQSSLDCDPQLMQAVLELSTSADAPPSRLSRKSTPPQVPVPVEPH
uniref:Uncharacterized protein n=1 Tax=Parascaris equorum TaxID=6256 RepID=A0A914R9W7_PAREQ